MAVKHLVENVRDIALVGHRAAGKTSLADALLYEAHAVDRMGSVDDGTSVADVRAIFNRAADIEGFTAIGGKDLEVSKEGDQIVVAFAYNKEIHLAGPAYLLMKYTGRSRLQTR